MDSNSAIITSRTLKAVGGVTAASYGAEILIVGTGAIEGGLYLDWINGFLVAITFGGIWYAAVRAEAHEIGQERPGISVTSCLWRPKPRLVATSAGLLAAPCAIAFYLWLEPTDGKGFAALAGWFCVLTLTAISIGALADGYRRGIVRLHDVRGFGGATFFGLLALTVGFPAFFSLGPFLIFGGGLLIVGSVHHAKLLKRWGALTGVVGCVSALLYHVPGAMPEPRGGYFAFVLALMSLVIGIIVARHRERTPDND
jgi:hypothetical protein